MKSLLAIAVAPLLAAACLEGQTSSFRDPEDGAFDVGGWISTRTGVLPIPSVITEPAVGYGGALALVLIHGGGIGGMRDAPPGVTGKPVPPDRWRYAGVVGRISPRLDTYDASGNAYFFNLDGWTLYQELRRRVAHTDLFLGERPEKWAFYVVFGSSW